MYNVKQIFSCTIMSIILLSNICYASMHTVSTTISYELNESDTIQSVKNILNEEALKDLSNQVFTKIKSESVINNETVTSDKILMHTESILRIIEKKYRKENSNGKIKVILSIAATINSEEIEKIIKNDTGKDSGKTAKVKITENADYYAGIGYRLYRDNNSTKALEYFQKALAIDNNNAISHWGLAKILYRDNVSEKLKHYKLFIDYASIIDYREEIVETLDEVEKYGG